MPSFSKRVDPVINLTGFKIMPKLQKKPQAGTMNHQGYLNIKMNVNKNADRKEKKKFVNMLS